MGWQTGNRRIGYIADDEHYSPKWIFDAFGVVFDLDVCAPEGGVPWIPAKKSFSIKDDGLSQNWHGLVWMNPPYSKTTPWVDKFMAHGNGIALMPISASNWCKDTLQTIPALCVANQRIYFEHPVKKKKCIMWQTGFYALGEGVEILEKAKIGRVFR
jgi:hypothetical protein